MRRGAPPPHGSRISGSLRTALKFARPMFVRQPGSIEERTVDIEFLDAGAEAYCFTFG